MAAATQFAPQPKSFLRWLAPTLLALFFVPLSLNPTHAEYVPTVTPLLENARLIGQVLFQYATDHDGAFPTGKSSTEVFQKLIDEKYVSDSSIFWFEFPGKTKPTSGTLKPENVCWDVTVPLDTDSSEFTPLVFCTGYTITYTGGASAVPLPKSPDARQRGLAVCYKGQKVMLLKIGILPDGTVPNFVPSTFDPAGKTYQQLTPDGPLAP